MSGWLEARNILAIRPDNIGDVIMLGPALRAIKETSPHARITLLASPAGSAAVPLLPWVDDVIPWRPVWQDVGARLPHDAEREQELIRTIAEQQFDAAMIFTSFSQTPHVPGYVCYLAGIPLRAGESKEFGGSTLTHEITPAPDSIQQAERNLRLIESLGFHVRDRHLAVEIDGTDRESAGRILAEIGISAGDPYILVHPGASAEARRYPAERSAEVVRLLSNRGWQVIVTGTPRDAEVIETVRHSAPAVPYVTDSSLGTFASLVERASLVICGNTLPLHLADALDTSLVVLYSGTDYEEQWRPRRSPARVLRRPTACHPCYLFTCPIGQPCLDITPAEVVDAAEAMIGEARPTQSISNVGSERV